MAGFFAKEKVVNKVVMIAVDKIVPNPAQPRRDFNRKDLEELAASIRENGVLQPITVRRTEQGYELISGERRLRASRLAEQREVPAVIVDSNSRQSAIYAVLENIQRKDLNIFEEARALQSLIHEWGVTQEEAAKKLGKAQSTIANKLRLLTLTDEEQRIILDNGLTERHARALLVCQDNAQRLEALRYAVSKRLNVAQLEDYLQNLSRKEQHPPKKRMFIVKDVRIFLNTINKAIDTMKNAGIPAEAVRQETDNCIEYRVRIPLGQSQRM